MQVWTVLDTVCVRAVNVLASDIDPLGLVVAFVKSPVWHVAAGQQGDKRQNQAGDEDGLQGFVCCCNDVVSLDGSVRVRSRDCSEFSVDLLGACSSETVFDEIVFHARGPNAC